MPGISGIRKSYVFNNTESKIQSWQILLTSSMLRLCWPVTHFFLKSIESVCTEEKCHLKKKMKSYASNTTDKVQEEKDDIK